MQPPDYWKFPFTVVEVSSTHWQVESADQYVNFSFRYEEDALSVCYAINKAWWDDGLRSAKQ